MSESEARKYRWDDVPRERLSDSLERQMITGERLMVTHIHLKRGALVPRHSHANEQVSYVLRGELRFWTGPEGEEREHGLRSGEAIVVPGHVPHRVEAVDDTLSLDIFSPPRQDWLDGTDDYLRG
jgi:quercetin dioxygenase-like cupin family protein